MAYLPRKQVEDNIIERMRKTKDGYIHVDYEAYLGTDAYSRQAKRITRSTKKKLIAAIRDFYQRLQYGGDAAVRLSAPQAVDAKNALDMIATLPDKVSLSEIVSRYVEDMTSDAILKQKTVAAAYQEFFDAKYMKADADERNADANKTTSTTGRWVGTLGNRTLVSLTAKEILDYLVENFGERKPKTYNSHLLYLKTFLNWCCKEEQGYLDKNPIRLLKFKPEPWEEPEYMKPADVEKLFRLLEAHKKDRPDMLAYAIVSFFCGCRGIEIVRMATDPDATKISLEDMTVRIAKGKGHQQGKKPRAFTIDPTALAWMRSFDFMSALKQIKTEKRMGMDTQMDIYRLARAKGIPVFHNCGRHTFITYHVSKYGDPAKTTAMVGTSDKMRADNYCGLASKAEGEAYFAIMPTA